MPESMWRAATAGLGASWCGVMHNSPMWPIHSRYECRVCGRHYRVLWSDTGIMAQSSNGMTGAPVRLRHPRRSLRAALFGLVLLLAVALASSVHAADEPGANTNAGAAMAFARYTAIQAQAKSWNSETVEIEASLPKLEKQGRMRAIRRVLLGKPEYRMLQFEGDAAVKQQVIVRYLSADVRAAEIPVYLVSLTPENYKFHYQGVVKTDSTVAYVFLITPRRKQEGLIKGELWLDGATGLVVRQSGYLVKRPSIFVKRVDVTRETTLRNGSVEARVTHLSVYTRLFGRAELTIHEYPCADPDSGYAQRMEEQ